MQTDQNDCLQERQELVLSDVSADVWLLTETEFSLVDNCVSQGWVGLHFLVHVSILSSETKAVSPSSRKTSSSVRVYLWGTEGSSSPTADSSSVSSSSPDLKSSSSDTSHTSVTNTFGPYALRPWLSKMIYVSSPKDVSPSIVYGTHYTPDGIPVTVPANTNEISNQTTPAPGITPTTVALLWIHPPYLTP